MSARRRCLLALLPVVVTVGCGDSAPASDATADGTSGDPSSGPGPSGPDAESSADASTDPSASTSDTAESETGSETDDTGTPTCDATHTAAEPTLWSLPEPTTRLQGEPFVELGGAESCANNDVDFRYTTTDLTADGIVDLVVTSACDAGEVGTDFWLIYPGGSEGFAAEPTLWSLPEPTTSVQGEPFVQLGGAESCADNDVDFRYTTTDLTADGIVDLVVTSACDAGDVGTDFWLVYPGGSEGFAAEPTLWSLPEPTTSVQGEPFVQLGGAESCADNDVDFRYSTTDLTADGIVDLVVTSACDAGDVGTDFWLVYPGGSEGFAAEPTLWSLPEPTTTLQGEPFVQLGGAESCADNDVDFRYTTTDLTADGIVDLVVTSACDAGDVGTDFWLVYAGGSEGFAAEPTLWSLPEPTTSVQGEPFVQLGGAESCADNDVDFRYTTADLTADGIADLVVTSACDAGDVGTDFWLVYLGGSEGFAAEPTLWSLPEPTTSVQGEPFVQLGGAESCADNDVDFRYTTTDLTADGIVDLVVTSACDTGDVGTAFWLVYPGQCRG